MARTFAAGAFLAALAGWGAASWAQTPAPVSFDVASVKPSKQPYLALFPQRSGGRVTWTTDLTYCIAYAFHVDRSRLAGAIPGSDFIYEISATMPADTSEDDVRRMFQSLLVERFKLATHRESKETEGYALTVAKGGPKINEWKQGDPVPPMPDWMGKVAEASLDGRVVGTLPTVGVTTLTARRVTMAQLAGGLERQLGGFVTDETGLSGRYYIAFKYARDDASPEVDLPRIYQALASLGLRLEKHKGAVEILVVDHVEKTPVEN
jgi:uncharacterized protein (TIGR03435 family)